MGLFIGASIMTILELFDYVYEVIKVIRFSTVSKIEQLLSGEIVGKDTAKTEKRKGNCNCPCYH